MPAILVNQNAVSSVASSFSFGQRQLRFFKIAVEDNGNTAIDLTNELGSDSSAVLGAADTDNRPGLVMQVVQVLQMYGTVEHMRVGNADATDGFIFCALDVGGSAEEDGATWVPRLAGGSATTLPAAIQADIRVLRTSATPGTAALGSAGTTAGKDGNVDVRGTDVTETGLVLTA